MALDMGGKMEAKTSQQMERSLRLDVSEWIFHDYLPSFTHLHNIP
jgi:hypothetical protein